MKVGSAVNFRIETVAAHDEFALKQNNPCVIGLGSVGASQPLHFDTRAQVQSNRDGNRYSECSSWCNLAKGLSIIAMAIRV